VSGRGKPELSVNRSDGVTFQEFGKDVQARLGCRVPPGARPIRNLKLEGYKPDVARAIRPRTILAVMKIDGLQEWIAQSIKTIELNRQIARNELE
jgi:hypothetical protein